MISPRFVVAALLVVSGASTRTGVGQLGMLKMFKKMANLRAPGPAPAAAPEAAPAAGPADPCMCSFRDMCTCESALAHMDCISKTCSSAECDCSDVQFSTSCGEIASVCKPSLEITCTPEEAVCDGKFYQLSTSTLGLSIDHEKLDEDAHCGPTGKCAGELPVYVSVFNKKDGMTLECFLEDAPKSKDKHHCSSEVTGDFANCTLPMPKSLPAGDKLEGWCRLVDRADDGKSLSERLSHDAPFFIWNHHTAINLKVEKAPAPPPPAKKKTEAKPETKSGALSALGYGTAALFTILAATLQL